MYVWDHKEYHKTFFPDLDFEGKKGEETASTTASETQEEKTEEKPVAAAGGNKKNKKKKNKEKEKKQNNEEKKTQEQEGPKIDFDKYNSETITLLKKFISNLNFKIFEEKDEKKENVQWARGFFSNLVHNSIPVVSTKKLYIPLDYKQT